MNVSNVAPSGQKVAIIQNYYTPYRAALFEALGALCDLTLLYIHRPENEGRAWKPVPPQRFRSFQAAYFYLGKMIFFSFNRYGGALRDTGCVVLLDDNPSNIAMICLALRLRLFSRKRVLVWIEHIPDPTKSPLKQKYQKLCSRILVALCDGVLAFSAMTEMYLQQIGANRPIFRVNQAVPAPSPFNPAPRPRQQIRKFGYLGSASPRKNLHALIEAFQKLDTPGAELHIAGVEPSSRDADGGDARVQWHGYVDGPAKEQFFDTIDALVLPSLADPWGLVVNEALYGNCLVLVSERCGASELVGSIDRNLVFTPAVDDIRRAMGFAVALDESRLEILSKAASELLIGYSIEGSATRIEHAIGRL